MPQQPPPQPPPPQPPPQQPPPPSSIVWIPLPRGPWVPGLVLGADAEARLPSPIWARLRPDCCVVLPFPLSGAAGSAQLALVPLASVRAPFRKHLPALQSGLVPGRGKPSASDARLVAEAVKDACRYLGPDLGDVGKRALGGGADLDLPAAPPPPPQLPAKKRQRQTSAGMKPPPPPQPAHAAMLQQPLPAPHMCTRLLRVWDALYNLRGELGLDLRREMELPPAEESSMAFDMPTADSLAVAFADQESSLHAYLMAFLLSYLARTVRKDPKAPLWVFRRDRGLVCQDVRSPFAECTRLTWACLLDDLVEQGVLPRLPEPAAGKLEQADMVVQAVLELPQVKAALERRAGTLLAPDQTVPPDDAVRVVNDVPPATSPELALRRKLLLVRLERAGDVWALEEALDRGFALAAGLGWAEWLAAAGN
jgi:hypothetical protein